MVCEDCKVEEGPIEVSAPHLTIEGEIMGLERALEALETAETINYESLYIVAQEIIFELKRQLRKVGDK